MGYLNLPEDLIRFLKVGKELDYESDRCECGAVRLVPLEELALSELYVDSENSPWADQDPHAGERGYYSVPGVNLIAECDGYDPEGILIWLPDLGLFGTWDNDHWNILVFPDATWSDIVADAVKYLNAQWRPQESNCEVLIPDDRFSFQTGRPWNSE